MAERKKRMTTPVPDRGPLHIPLPFDEAIKRALQVPPPPKTVKGSKKR